MNNLGWSFVEDSESRGSAPTFSKSSTFTNVPYIIDTALFRVVHIGFCFSHDANVFLRVGDDDSVGTYKCFHWAKRGILEKNQTYSRNHPQLPQRRDRLQKHPQLCLLRAVRHSLRTAEGHASPRPKLRYTSRPLDSLSGGVRFDNVCVTLVSQGTARPTTMVQKMYSQYRNELGSASCLMKHATSTWTHMIETVIETLIRKLLFYEWARLCRNVGIGVAGVASRALWWF